MLRIESCLVSIFSQSLKTRSQLFSPMSQEKQKEDKADIKTLPTPTLHDSSLELFKLLVQENLHAITIYILSPPSFPTK